MFKDVITDVIKDIKAEPNPNFVVQLDEKVLENVTIEAFSSLDADDIMKFTGLSIGDQYAVIYYVVKTALRSKENEFNALNLLQSIKGCMKWRNYEEYNYRWKPLWLRQVDLDHMAIYDAMDFGRMEEDDVSDIEARWKSMQDAKKNLQTTKYKYECKVTIKEWYERTMREAKRIVGDL